MSSPDRAANGALFASLPPSKVTLPRVLKALRELRIREAGLQESELRDRTHALLVAAGFPQAQMEVKFGQGCRADIWIDGIVVELKKKRPNRAAVMTQLHRYARQENVRGVILVLEKSIVLHQDEIDGVPVAVMSLNALWGIAL